MRMRCSFCKELTWNWAYSLESFYGNTRVRKRICMYCAYDREEIIAFDKDFKEKKVLWESEDGTVGGYGTPQFVGGLRRQVEKIREEIRSGQRPFRAKYPGICIKCDERINIGEPIYFQERKGVWHQDCGFVPELKASLAKLYSDDDYDEDYEGRTTPKKLKEPETSILTTGRKFRLVQ